MKFPGQLAARYLPEHESTAHVVIVLAVSSHNRNLGTRLTRFHKVSGTQIEFKRVTFAEFRDTDNTWCTFK